MEGKGKGERRNCIVSVEGIPYNVSIILLIPPQSYEWPGSTS
jgi:hypothetical protein